MRKKRELTKKLIEKLPAERPCDLDEAMRTWWCNLRESGGYRLTDVGFLMLASVLGLEYYEHSLKVNPLRNLKILLKMDQQLQAPYYLIKRRGLVIGIAFFNSKEAVLASLYGDIDQFLNNYND